MIPGDTFRAAAAEQLAEWGRRAGAVMGSFPENSKPDVVIEQVREYLWVCLAGVADVGTFPENSNPDVVGVGVGLSVGVGVGVGVGGCGRCGRCACACGWVWFGSVTFFMLAC